MSRLTSWLQRAFDRAMSLQSGDWVELEQPPDPWSSPVAMLLCELPDERSWVAWVPDFGELVVSLEHIIS